MTPSTTLQFELVPFEPRYQPDFYRLNAAWIAPNHGMEAEDETFLSDPQGKIIDLGGAVFFVKVIENNQSAIVGTAGLVKMDEDTYELVRLAVEERYQGHGLGKRLTLHALDLAKQMGAQRVILETSIHPVNERALILYEKLGFRHYEPKPEHRSALARAQVWMIYEPLP